MRKKNDRRIGVVPLAAKPAHRGHLELIELAGSECDSAVVFVSTSDRIKRGEFPVYGEVMVDVWERMIEPLLPLNVGVDYVPNPVAATYALIGAADDVQDGTTWVIYSDPVDLVANFPEDRLWRYFPRLSAKGRVVGRPVSRSETTEVSGTQMRAWLRAGDKASFVAMSPSDEAGEAAWEACVRAKRSV